MNEYKKPPLGCRPCYIAAGERIQELASAIKRYATEPENYSYKIQKWAKEIVSQCDIVVDFQLGDPPRDIWEKENVYGEQSETSE